MPEHGWAALIGRNLEDLTEKHGKRRQMVRITSVNHGDEITFTASEYKSGPLTKRKALGVWGIGIFDAPDGGNLLFYSLLGRALERGDSIQYEG
jgi:hypothetical protein